MLLYHFFKCLNVALSLLLISQSWFIVTLNVSVLLYHFFKCLNVALSLLLISQSWLLLL